MKSLILIFLVSFCPIFLLAQAEGERPGEPLALSFSMPGGFYTEPIAVELFAPGARIYYTLTGSEPDQRDQRYQEPLRISRSCVLRAVAYRDGQSSPILSATYLIDEPPSTLPVVSIGIESRKLFDPERGLFTQGSKADTMKLSMPGANFWSRQELPASVEIYETDGRCVYQSRSGLRLFGGISRLFPQKSLAIVARENYGEKRIRYPLFGPGAPKEFKYLVLRNGGSDFNGAHFRDALITSLVKDWDLDVQAYRPARVYINGKYWGLYNIREKINRFYISAHHDVGRDSVDILEHRFTIKRGTGQHYQQLLAFLDSNDLSEPSNYAYVARQMQISNFIDFQIAQIFFDNQDAGGNIRFWRPYRPDGRWRWILFDTDWGMGLHDPLAYRNNSLAFHTEANGPAWPNPPWSTFLLRKLLENPSFQRDFLNRFADHLNTSLLPAGVEKRIDEMYQEVLPEMPYHLSRWKLKMGKWENEVEVLHAFARERPRYMWGFLQEHFPAGELRPVELSASAGGRIVFNQHLEVRQEVFRGWYFANVPVQIQAIPDYGFRFSHWEGIQAADGVDMLFLKPGDKSMQLRAVFVPYENPLAGKLVINEINPNGGNSGDWVELFNAGDYPIYLKGFFLRDRRGNVFHFPDMTLNAKDYLVACEDPVRFRLTYPQSYNVIGPLGFGINKMTESLYLCGADGSAIDSTGYDIPPTDSTFSLSLLLPWLDNSRMENWTRQFGPGTPGAPNPYYLESRIQAQQTRWLQIGVAGGIALLCLLLLATKKWWGTD